MSKASLLPFSDAAKLAMANYIIEQIDSHAQNLGISSYEENETRYVHIDTENMNESCCLDTIMSEAILRACKIDGIRCGID